MPYQNIIEQIDSKITHYTSSESFVCVYFAKRAHTVSGGKMILWSVCSRILSNSSNVNFIVAITSHFSCKLICLIFSVIILGWERKEFEWLYSSKIGPPSYETFGLWTILSFETDTSTILQSIR